MTVRLFALVSAASLAALVAAAPAQADPRGARATMFGGAGMSGGGYFDQHDNCRTARSAYRCAMTTYAYRGTSDALPLFQRAARQGSPQAMRALGYLYLRGDEGVRADPEQGVGWLYEAALRGDTASMFALGRAFEEGVGVEADARLGRFWIARAAEGGYDRARRALSERQ